MFDEKIRNDSVQNSNTNYELISVPSKLQYQIKHNHNQAQQLNFWCINTNTQNSIDSKLNEIITSKILRERERNTQRFD